MTTRTRTTETATATTAKTVAELAAEAKAAQAAVKAAREAEKAQKAKQGNAKQALARTVIDAIAALELSDEDKKTVAQWTHHLPTGRTESGARYWPAGLPVPDRADWREVATDTETANAA